ncbi:WSC domain-containing protein, partial [Favolaschia claudopus]
MITATFGAAIAIGLPFVGASVVRKDASVWTLQGCFTDSSTSRTLAGTSFASANMTVESCTSVCDAGGFSLAGVEFGSECFCDHALQSPGTLTSTSNCNKACGGASTEFCGAGNFIDVYWNGTPPPTSPLQVGTWTYSGCFSDSVSSRQLPNRQTTSGGVTVESCTSACKASGLAIAGLEFGQECWCGSGPLTSSLSNDNNCATACVANTTEFCGGASRLQVYQDLTAQVCLSSTLTTGFNLNAVPVTPNAPAIPLHVHIIQTVPLVSWSVLTALSDTLFTSTLLTNGGLLPMSTSQPQFRTASLTTKPGDSPIFVTTQFPPTAVGPYCAMANPLVPNGPQVLGLNGRNDLWALCTNISTSNPSNRIDAVYSPGAGNPHYNLSSCQSVLLEIV